MDSIETAGAVARAGELSRRHSALTLELNTVKAELGGAFKLLHVDGGRSWRDLGAEFGMSHTQARRLAEESIDSGDFVPVLDWEEAPAALAGFGEISRIVIAFEVADVLVASRLDPRAFALGSAIRTPNLLLQNSAGVWAGVRDCMCGYGGTGPHNTVALLTELGLTGDLRRIVMGHSYIDVPVIDRELVPEQGVLEAEPRAKFSPPRDVDASGAVVAKLRSRRWDRWADGEGMTGELIGWAEAFLLAEDPPAWAAGPLRARCYTSYEAVEEAGLRSSDESYTLVLERGSLQIWCPAYLPVRHHELLSSEVRAVLAQLELIDGEEPRGLLDRIVQRIAGISLPPFIDLPEGESLTHDPAAAARA